MVAMGKFLVPEIIFGIGALAEVGQAVRRLGGTRVFVVSDPGVIGAGWVDASLEHLDEAGLSVHLWSDLTPNPKDHEIAAGFKAYVQSGCDALIAIGGGSCIDTAKSIAVLSGNGGQILDYEGIDKVTKPIPPLVMCPSTGGTGADVSQFAVITDTTRLLKATLIGRALVPDISITDPRLLLTMPPDLTAHCGMDALSHGIEAYVSRAASHLTDIHALESIRLVAEHLPRSVESPADLGAREGMARASLSAGMAFTNAILGCVHALSHQIGGALDLPHGLLNAVLLPHVMRFNAEADPARYVAVAQALGAPVEGMGFAEAAQAACDEVRLLADKLGIPRGLADLGVTRGHFELFAENALHDACMTTNPREVSAVDLVQIFLAAL
ncbi:MAG: iron-containing alcohol dehydrogenase [Egibacteraceae bacterium]